MTTPAPTTAPVKAHLKTQDGQPYGSERRCCERCGVMIWGQVGPVGEAWTDDRAVFRNLPEGFIACDAPKHSWGPGRRDRNECKTCGVFEDGPAALLACPGYNPAG